MESTASRREVDWTNVLVLAAVHALSLVALWWCAAHFSWWSLALAIVWFALCGLSITGGYHRLFAHPTYKAHPALEAFYLCFGAASVQNSALKWSSDHRAHHANVDEEADPYNIRRGFWWAHIGWVLFKEADPEPRNVRDLQANPRVMFQHRHYVLLAIVFGFVLPMGIGALWGDPIGGLLLAGFLRLAVQWHATFAVNSVAHCVGSQPYTRENSARDSFLTALITLGEGYHNFHHRFQADYRNGVRAWHFDPTKWFVWTMSKLGVTRDLRRVPSERIHAALRDTAAVRSV